MKTTASQFGSAPAGRTALDHLGEGPRSSEHLQRSGEVPSPSSTAGASGHRVGVAQGFRGEAHVQFDAQHDDHTSHADVETAAPAHDVSPKGAAVSFAHRQDGVTGASSGAATKFATELARMVAAADASDAGDKADATSPEDQALSDDNVLDDVSGDDELFSEEGRIATAGELAETPIPAAAAAGGGPVWPRSVPVAGAVHAHASASSADGGGAIRTLAASDTVVHADRSPDHASTPTKLPVAEAAGQGFGAQVVEHGASSSVREHGEGKLRGNGEPIASDARSGSSDDQAVSLLRASAPAEAPSAGAGAPAPFEAPAPLGVRVPFETSAPSPRSNPATRSGVSSQASSPIAHQATLLATAIVATAGGPIAPHALPVSSPTASADVASRVLKQRPVTASAGELPGKTVAVDAQTTALPAPPKLAVVAPMARAVATDGVRSPFALPVPQRNSVEGQTVSSKRPAHEFARTETAPKAPVDARRGAPASASPIPVAVDGNALVASVETRSTVAPITGSPLGVMNASLGVHGMAAATHALASTAPSAKTSPPLAHAKGVAVPPTTGTVVAATLASAPTHSSTKPSTKVGDLPLAPAPFISATPDVTPPASKKEGSAPLPANRRELTSGQRHPSEHPTIGSVVAPTTATGSPATSVLAATAIERSSSAPAPSAPAKLSSQALEVEHASRRRAAMAPTSGATPRKPARVQRREGSPRVSASPAATSSPTVESAPPSSPEPTSIVDAHPAVPPSSPGRLKLPSLIPLDHGLRLASVQRFASPAPHPTSPVDTNAPPPATAASSPGLESRRVRAAVLDLVQRSVSESSLATSASRKGIDTAPSADKSGSNSSRRAPVLVNGGTLSSERPLFVAPHASTAEAPVSRDGAPVGQRRAPRDENATVSPRRTSAAASATVHPVLPAVAAALTAPSQARAPKSAHEVGPSRVSGASKPSAPVLPSLAATESLDGSRAERTASPPSPSRPAQEAPVARAAATPAGHPAAPAPSQELPTADLSLPASASAPRALLEQAAADPTLHATAIGNNAHLRLETADAGSLSLHLHMRDGVADLEVEGAGARSLDLRPQDLRRALAGEGITLGRFETRTNEADSARSPDPAVSQASGGHGASSNGNSGSSTNDNSPPPPSETQRGAAAAFSSNSNASSFSDGRRSWNSDGSDGRDRDQRAGSDAGQSPATPAGNGPRRRRGFHVMA